MIPYGKHYIDEEDIQAVVDVLKGSLITQGPKIKEFEQNIANYVGAKYAIAVSSGTAALHLANIIVGFSSNEYAITSPISFVASALGPIYAGGKVLFCDIDDKDINIDHRLLEKLCNSEKKIKVIIPVHFGGLPCDMEKIKKIADQNKAFIIEDAAHALGASYKDGSKVGCCKYSDMTIFSFHPVKTIAAGEGGIITTNNHKTYRRLLRLRSHGINKLDDKFEIVEQSMSHGVNNRWYYEMQELGYHYRINDIQCALGISQLKKIDKFIKRRAEISKRYDKALLNLKNCYAIQLNKKKYSSHHLYVIRIKFDKINYSKAEFFNLLFDFGFALAVHYIPIIIQPYFQKKGINVADYPLAMKYYSEALSIPIHYSLTNSEQDRFISFLKKYVG